jgi:hypothetical protein
MNKKVTKKELENYVKHKHGEGLGDVWKWVKEKASQGHKYVKDNKLVTKGLRSYAASNPGVSGELAAVGSLVSDFLGYGRRKYSPPLKSLGGKGIKKGRGKTKLQSGLIP